MRIGFSQTAKLCVNGTINAQRLEKLPEVIHQHTDFNYSCEQTDNGCLLKPSFNKMTYRNSFVPEINIGISQNNGQTFLYMKGQPLKFVRVFMMFWFGFLLLMEIFLLAIAATFGLGSLFPIFIPIVMCALGYFLCKIATKTTFRAVIDTIEKEFL